MLLPWEKSIIYFVTICVKDRRKVLAPAEVFEAIKLVLPQLQKWNVLAGVIMPEHVHWVVSPVEDRQLSVEDFSHGFKRVLRKQLGPQSWEWQRRCFDRLLRSNLFCPLRANCGRCRVLPAVVRRAWEPGAISRIATGTLNDAIRALSAPR